MAHRSRTSTRLGLVLAVAMAVQATGCGTILHPERKGQKDGKIDTTVAILDGIGLLFFLVPGVIAFAVDFSNGTIYLPESGTDASPDGGSTMGEPAGDQRLVAVHVGVEQLDRATICDVVAQHTGHSIDPDDPRLVVADAPSVALLSSRLRVER